MLNILFAYFISFVIGNLFIVLIFPRNGYTYEKNDLYMHFVLSWPVGLGISSFLSFYLLLMFGNSNAEIFLNAHLIVVFILMLINIQNKKLFKYFDTISHRTINTKKLGVIIVLFSLFFLMLRPYLVNFRYGCWDAISAWNLRARLLLVSDNWLRSFSGLMWAVDYPILLPLNILWGWLFSGQDAVMVPLLISVVYSFSIIAFIFLATSRYYGLKKSVLVVLFLASITIFLEVASMQYADIVLSCYNVIGAVCCFFGIKENRVDYILIGEMALGFSIFTKNEGLLFFVFFNFFMLYYLLLHDRQLLRLYVYGILISIVSLLTLIVFKKTVGSPHIVFFSKGVPLLLFCKRAKEFFLYIPSMIFKIRYWSLSGYVFLTVFILLRNELFRGSRFIISLAALSTFLGYFVVYVLRIESSSEHLVASYARFIVHLLPLLCFLTADVLFARNKKK